ncbi:MAG: aminotransferase class I/II-fold pyridoxal phosphate-dependent enzyme [Deltaproteobacteria bacterium]|nr:aminotransferase class I/II-fold pyridoxal phosphate-dependent enzyme [Deltaproteobacteria bacterium]MBW2611403.1 aminotransferase class I/II-fold pyridoxal phosphate-dependent enzyme [Deltaproteobacteria bacterium]MBW2632798.1 aminotransferase class I/II-fold pyridoxal phosphate-dependent enzyme [Deltaproteobacteria bacterium]MBW2676927.1 aminotransferase class I/II-fold pyridoxal phosphate-dependent enzyme [Deltaproteobacteria bacterium]
MKGKPVVEPVYMTATYKFDRSDDLIDVVQNRSGYIYSRWDNPSVRAVESELADLEGYAFALGFGSGMAAITTAIMANIKAGDRVVATQEVYGGTYELLNDVLPTFNVDTALINCYDLDRLFAEIDKGLTLLYLETPTNPLLRVVDIKPLADAAHAKGAIVLLDATFASPVNQHPVDLGVDVVIHSATKYLGGHHDVTAGFICADDPWFKKIWNLRKVLGGVMDPMSAFMTLRGMRTLELRIQKHNENAMQVARFLEAQVKIKSVHYPGLASHPDHEIAVRQMSGFGGMLSFEVDGDFDQTKTFMDCLKKIKLATSLGGVTSLANQPITNTHVALSPENRAKAGVSESLVRLSVGIENVEVLIQDLEQALEVV